MPFGQNNLSQVYVINHGYLAMDAFILNDPGYIHTINSSSQDIQLFNSLQSEFDAMSLIGIWMIRWERRMQNI